MSLNKAQNSNKGDGSVFSAKLICLKNRTVPFILWSCVFLFTLYAISYTQDEFTYDSKSKRNPFIPLVTPDGMLLKLDKEEGSGNLSIEGIIYDKNGRSYAIVNGSVVEIGDFVSGYQVLRIEENKIIFIKDAQVTEVGFKKED